MSSADGLLAALLNILSLGAGYAYCGRVIQAVITLFFSFALFFLFSFLAAFSPWFVVFGGLFVLLILIGIAFDSFRKALRPMLKPHFLYAAAYVGIFLFAFNYVYLPARRVVFQVVADNSMEPTFFRGDRVALDRDYKEFKSGDIVVAEREDQSLEIRRIQEIKDGEVIVATDNKVHSQSEQIPTAALHGKVAYVLYSLDPDSWTMQWRRLLLSVD
jgi:signal peptidase I